MITHYKNKFALLGLLCLGTALAHYLYSADVARAKAEVYHPSVSFDLLTADQSSLKFGHNIIAQGYQPITITITNSSPQVLLLRSSSISLPLEKANVIIDATQHSTMLTSCCTITLSAVFFWPAIVPSIGVGIWMAWDNDRTQKKIAAAILQDNDTLTILPYEQLTKTIFVANDALKDTCSLHLFNIDTKEFIPYSFNLTGTPPTA